MEEAEELGALFRDTRLELVSIQLISDRYLMVETKTKGEYFEPNNFHNPVISSFVTAYGRLCLLDTLELLGLQVL